MSFFPLVAAIVAASTGAPTCPEGTTRRSLRLKDGSTTHSCEDREGRPHGPLWNTASGSRTRWIERYRHGVPDGLWVRFDGKGNPTSSRSYRKGRLHGPSSDSYADGRTKLNGAWSNGAKHGLFEGFHPNGTKAFEARFVDDEVDGAWTIWGRDRQVWARCSYQAGQLKQHWVRSPERQLTRSDLLAKLSEVKSGSRYCYEKELTRDAALAKGGLVEVRYSVTPVGLTASLAIERSTLAPVERCLLDLVARMRFPLLRTCELVDAHFPFDLSAE